MLRDFKSRLMLNVGITLGVLAILLIALFLVNRDIQAQSSKIKNARSSLETGVQQLSDLARLREEAKLARPNLAKLEAAIPKRDDLFSVRRDLEQLAGRNNLAVSFTFGNENPKEGKLGSVNFELKLQGGDFNIRSFINEVESSRSFVQVAALDMVRQENDFSAVLKGKILFSE